MSNIWVTVLIVMVLLVGFVSCWAIIREVAGPSPTLEGKTPTPSRTLTGTPSPTLTSTSTPSPTSTPIPIPTPSRTSTYTLTPPMGFIGGKVWRRIDADGSLSA